MMTDDQARALILEFRSFGWGDAELMAMFDANRDSAWEALEADPGNAELAERFKVRRHNADTVRWALHLLYVASIDAN